MPRKKSNPAPSTPNSRLFLKGASLAVISDYVSCQIDQENAGQPGLHLHLMEDNGQIVTEARYLKDTFGIAPDDPDARRDLNITFNSGTNGISIVFVRDDGFLLACTPKLEGAAYASSRDRWVAFIRNPGLPWAPGTPGVGETALISAYAPASIGVSTESTPEDDDTAYADAMDLLVLLGSPEDNAYEGDDDIDGD